MRPYLELNHVREGAFYVATRLYGIRFRPLTYMPLPHPEAQVFECIDKDGKTLGILYFDFFPVPASAAAPGVAAIVRRGMTSTATASSPW